MVIEKVKEMLAEKLGMQQKKSQRTPSSLSSALTH